MSSTLVQCPDCGLNIQFKLIKQHVLSCKIYKKTYFNNITKNIVFAAPDRLKFLLAQLQLTQQKIRQIIPLSDNSLPYTQLQKPNKIQILPPKNNKSLNSISNGHNLYKQNSLKKQYVQINQIKPHQANNQIKPHLSNNQINLHFQSNLDKYLQLKKRQLTGESQSSGKLKIKKKDSELQFMQSLFDKQQKDPLKSSSKSKQLKKSLKHTNSNQTQIYEVKQIYEDNQNNITCSNCKAKFTIYQVQQFCYGDLCLHPLCKKCMDNYLTNDYVKAKGKFKYPCPQKDCNEEIPFYQLVETFGKKRMDHIQNLLNHGFMQDLVTCIKCKSKFQFSKGNSIDAPKLNPQGKPLSQLYAQSFANLRFLCRDCKTEQCKTCFATPFHLGKTCQQFKKCQSQKKCRFCEEVLPLGYTSGMGIKAFDDICESDQCVKKTKLACSKIHKCGHSCFGLMKQKQCLPCLKQKCATTFQKELNGQNQDSYCKICFIQGLKNGPCIKIKCGHIFHYQCLQKRLKTRWFGPRIIFTFFHCPLCKTQIQVPTQSKLSMQVKEFKRLKDIVQQKALKRLKHEGQDKNEKITDTKSAYYKNESGYAMAIYAYFQCFKCKKPYFGGRKSCAEAMNDNKSQEEFKAEDLVCAQCCPISTKDCTKHGKQFISFKCKYCCSLAQWFCWGNTHFCDACHKKQVGGQYLNKIPKNKLPLCLGPGKCPIGGNHDGNGQTRSLGCSLCVDHNKNKQDF